MQPKKNAVIKNPPDARFVVEDVLKCKWTLSVLDLVRQGVYRPGAMVRQTPGLTTKVLNERLQKLQSFGVMTRTVYPEKPPRVEYHLTALGRKLSSILDGISELQKEMDSTLNA